MSDTTPTAPIAEKARGNRKERLGEVISNKMAKTIIVRVERRFPHPRFKKVVTGYKKFYAHDEKAEAKVGDRVRIEETRPIELLQHFGVFERSGLVGDLLERFVSRGCSIEMERGTKKQHVAHDAIDLRISAGRQRGGIDHC